MNDDANPYAPPAPEEERDSDVVLARNEAYRVVGNKLYCRRGMERFPGICWLTGSTERLVGVHSKKGRYLPKKVFLLSAIGNFLWCAALMQMDLPLLVFSAGFMLLVVSDSVLRRIFGKSFELVVGDTQTARTHRLSHRRFVCWSVGISVVAAVAVVYLVYWVNFAFILVVPFGIVSLGVVYLVKQPRFFSATIGEHADDVLVVRGLTAEFLEALQHKDDFSA